MKDPEERWKNEFSADILPVNTLSPEELKFINEEKKEKEGVSNCTTIQAVDKPMLDKIMDRHNEFHKVMKLGIHIIRDYLSFKERLKPKPGN